MSRGYRVVVTDVAPTANETHQQRRTCGKTFLPPIAVPRGNARFGNNVPERERRIMRHEFGMFRGGNGMKGGRTQFLDDTCVINHTQWREFRRIFAGIRFDGDIVRKTILLVAKRIHQFRCTQEGRIVETGVRFETKKHRGRVLWGFLG